MFKNSQGVRVRTLGTTRCSTTLLKGNYSRIWIQKVEDNKHILTCIAVIITVKNYQDKDKLNVILDSDHRAGQSEVTEAYAHFVLNLGNIHIHT